MKKKYLLPGLSLKEPGFLMKKFLIFFILAFLFIPSILGAGEVIPLKQIQVEAESIQQKEETTADLSSYTTIIYPDKYKEKARNVAELLSESVGIHLRRFGIANKGGYISIRGSSTEQVTVMLDGVVLNSARYSSVNLADIPLDQIERIEIYRGTSPGKFSAIGMGGVINIITKKAKSKSRGGVRLSYGSFNTFHLGIFESGRIGKLDQLISLSSDHTDGDFPFKDNNATPFNPDDDRITHRKNNKLTSGSLLLKLSTPQKGGKRLTIIEHLFMKKEGVPGIGSNQSKHAYLTSFRNLFNIKLSNDKLPIPRLGMDTEFYYLYLTEKFNDRYGEIGIGNQLNRNQTDTIGGNIIFTYPWKNYQLITFLMGVKWERFKAWDLLADEKELDPQKRVSTTLSFDDEIYLMNNRLILSPTIRYDFYHSEFGGITSFHSFNTESISRNKHTWAAKFGARYKLFNSFFLKSNIGRYYRMPSFYELFGDRGTVVGNPELKPENSINSDIGFVWEGSFRFFKRIFLEYALFYHRYKDLILFIQNSQTTVQARNISEASVWGYEISWGADILNFIKIRGNYTYQDSEDKSSISYWKGNRLAGRPVHEIFNKVEFVWPDYGKLFYELNFIGDYYLDRANFYKVKERTIHNIGITAWYKKERNPTLTFEIKNLTDERSYDFLGYPLPGRAYYLTFNYTF